MQKIVLLLSLGTLLMASSAMAQNSRICFDCTYQQALEMATEAAPQLSCRFNGPIKGIDNEACFSEPKSLVVFDGVNQQSWGFLLAHLTQGLPRAEMELQVTTQQVNPDLHRLLSITAEGRQQLQQKLAAIPMQVLQDWRQISSAQPQRQASDACATDKDAKAIHTAFNPFLNTQWSEALRNRIYAAVAANSGWLDSLLPVSVTLDTFTFGVTDPRSGLTASGTFKITPKDAIQSFTHIFHPDGSEKIYAGLHAYSGETRLIYHFDTTNKSAILKVDHELSIIDGLRLHALLNSSGNSISVSDCVLKALQKNFKVKATSNPGSGGRGPLPPPVIGGSGGFGGGKGGGEWWCTYDIYTNGKLTGNIAGRC